MSGTGNPLQLACFTDLDRNFARFLGELTGDGGAPFLLAAMLVSRRTGEGDTCIDLRAMAGRVLADAAEMEGSGSDITLPKEKEWISALRNNPAVGGPSEHTPLVLDDGGRLYLRRYYGYERFLAARIGEWAAEPSHGSGADRVKESLDRLFPGEESEGQRLAAAAAFMRRFCVIAGGPGTGKTSTVVKVLVLLLEDAAAEGRTLSIALAAPTGKAAVRLKESIKRERDGLPCGEEIRRLIPEEAFTLHRLLGVRYGSPYFRHDAENPLPYDAIVVDESSMADLALMARLFAAVPPKARLILLGDRDQLASVEAGAVLGDICDTGTEHGYTAEFAAAMKKMTGVSLPETEGRKEPPIADSLVLLRRSFRFGSGSGIGELARAIRSGDAESALGLLREERFADITLRETTAPRALPRALEVPVLSGYREYLAAATPGESLGLYGGFAILCALRHGPYGVLEVNRAAEEILRADGLIGRESPWYRGRPIMVTRNDYGLGLFNGDIGILFPSPGGGEGARAFFPAPDGSVRPVLPSKLPAHETAFAMTVHKAQGSEFDGVLLVLPDRPGRVLTRELLYTAVTRARKRVEIWGSDEVLREAIGNPIRRKSGLRDALWGGD